MRSEGRDSSKGADSRPEHRRGSSDCADSKSEGPHLKSNSSRVCDEDGDSGTTAGEDSGSDIERLTSDVEWLKSYTERSSECADLRSEGLGRLRSDVGWSSSNDGEGIEGDRRRDSERSSHNVGVSKSGVDEASRTDTASRDHDRSRLPCCNRSELEDGRESKFRDRKLSELNVVTGAGWDPRATSDRDSELEV